MSSEARDLPDPEISIVLASVESEANIAAAFAALRITCRGITSEIIVVDASLDRSAALVRALAAAGDGAVELLERAPGTITPELWADGIRQSKGQVVALTTGHCVVPPAWAPDLLSTITGRVVAAGAGLTPAVSARPLDLAVYFLRYHAFVEITTGEPRPSVEIPGDNAAYLGGPVRDYVAKSSTGFYETEYHRTLRQDGATIMAVPTAAAQFGRSFPLATIVRHRFDHGRQFGSWRTRKGGEPSVLIALKAPLVPLVLFVRAWVRIGAVRGLRRRLVASLPWFSLLATAWAMGEATGALFGSPHDDTDHERQDAPPDE